MSKLLNIIHLGKKEVPVKLRQAPGRYSTASVAGLSLSFDEGGKSGQRRVPYHLTDGSCKGRNRKCHRKETATLRCGKGENVW